MNLRIKELVRILTSFKRHAEPGVSKKVYRAEFFEKVRLYYGYSAELTEYFGHIFLPKQLVEFYEANETPKLLTIRTNTLKTRRRELSQALIQRGVNLESVGSWSKVGLRIIESRVPMGATPEYLAGHYILQAASSFLPVMALAPQPGERVLDLCAAPGGKSTHIAQLMKNSGVLISNDASLKRTKALTGNLQRLGVTNALVTNYDARRLPKFFSGFDRILLDAPCSGLGVIYKDPSVKLNRTVGNIKRNSYVQKELILVAIDSLNSKSQTGGYLVYSTCSVAVDENESVVQYALDNRKVKLVETGLEVGDPGFLKFRGKVFDPKMTRCRRVYPHAHDMDGFFVAKFKKLEDTDDATANLAEETPKHKKVGRSETDLQDQTDRGRSKASEGRFSKDTEIPKKRSRAEDSAPTSSSKKAKATGAFYEENSRAEAPEADVHVKSRHRREGADIEPLQTDVGKRHKERHQVIEEPRDDRHRHKKVKQSRVAAL